MQDTLLIIIMFLLLVQMGYINDPRTDEIYIQKTIIVHEEHVSQESTKISSSIIDVDKIQ